MVTGVACAMEFPPVACAGIMSASPASLASQLTIETQGENVAGASGWERGL